jgi:dTDP-4-dehydrorhamnose reductase
LKDIKPHIVLNAAAYTNVEKAEVEPNAAFEVNQTGVRNIMRACDSVSAKLVHFSTDYVFSGIKTSPWQVEDLANPLSNYGKSKLAGELEIMNNYSDNSLIIRTAWLYSQYGKNFYKTILDKAINTRDNLKVVSDQTGQPTNALELAEITIEAIRKEVMPGIFHATNSGSTSWFEFSRLIFKLAGEDPLRVNPVLASEFPSKVNRPQYSVLDNRKWNDFGIAPLESWEESVTKAFLSISKSLN